MRLLVLLGALAAAQPSFVGAWVVQPAAPARINAVAGLCIDEFEKLQMPFFPLPGWKERAREDAISQWISSREELLSGSQLHAILVAERNQADSGRYFEGIEDGLLGFAELGLLPAPPEKQTDRATRVASGISDDMEASAGDESLDDAVVKSPEMYPYLANLAVKAGARRLGLGKELVIASERKAVDSGFNRMYIKVARGNVAARRLYDKLGYRLVYLQPAGWRPNQGPTDTNLFLRRDFVSSDGDGSDRAIV